jgi:hypothetical protein
MVYIIIIIRMVIIIIRRRIRVYIKHMNILNANRLEVGLLLLLLLLLLHGLRQAGIIHTIIALRPRVVHGLGLNH